ncbi:MAG: hypothetical protein LBT85_01080 [Bifidobacteriaceae bacterium]|jgi:uncharacterized protein (TIGR02145 family)|nr:hypothetical protein [Bifidobacteriaceae bacterium]
MLNFTNLKLRKIKLKKSATLASFAIFAVVSFLAGASISNAAASGAALPISFGGTGGKTQSAALTNLGINNTIDENSTNSTFPSAKTVYDYMSGSMNKVSMDNINFFSSITSWTGGDLIYKDSDLSTIATNNKIKVGDKVCTTSGQSYISNSAAGDGIPQVGCVLPDLAAGTHAVAISTNGGTSYTINAGKVIYTQTPTLANCDTTSMQTFGANATACKASMAQGQVIVLNDSRNNQKYRVKKMPDGNIWMIDNLKYASGSYWNPSSIAYCSSSGLVKTHNPGSFTDCGYLYNWSTSLTVSPSGWSLHPNSGTKSGYELNTKMLTAAANSAGNRNPVYSTTDHKNFGEGATGNPAPWLGVYSGYYNTDGKFYYQNSGGWIWSANEVSDSFAYELDFYPSSLYLQDSRGPKGVGNAVRSVL